MPPSSRMIDPRACPIALDANALDENGTATDELVRRFRSMAAAGAITVVVPGGVTTELAHARTPASVQEALLPHGRNRSPALTQAQQITRIRVRAILRGNAPSGTHDADAAHLCEAAETGCAYFITHDKRILRRRADLGSALPALEIVSLAAFFAIVDARDPGPPR